MSEHSERARHDRPAGIAFVIAWVGTPWIFTAAGLHLTVALGIGFVVAFLAAFTELAIQNSRPLPVPPELADDFVKLQHDGWRRAWVHPWWSCTETLPHTHLVHKGDHAPLVFIWRGRQAWHARLTLQYARGRLRSREQERS